MSQPQFNPKTVNASLLHLIQQGHQIGAIAVMVNPPLSAEQANALNQLGVLATQDSDKFVYMVDLPTHDQITSISNASGVDLITMGAYPQSGSH